MESGAVSSAGQLASSAAQVWLEVPTARSEPLVAPVSLTYQGKPLISPDLIFNS